MKFQPNLRLGLQEARLMYYINSYSGITAPLQRAVSEADKAIIRPGKEWSETPVLAVWRTGWGGLVAAYELLNGTGQTIGRAIDRNRDPIPGHDASSPWAHSGAATRETVDNLTDGKPFSALASAADVATNALTVDPARAVGTYPDREPGGIRNALRDIFG